MKNAINEFVVSKHLQNQFFILDSEEYQKKLEKEKLNWNNKYKKLCKKSKENIRSKNDNFIEKAKAKLEKQKAKLEKQKAKLIEKQNDLELQKDYIYVKKWFWISLYDNDQSGLLSKKEKYLVKQYEQLQGYVKAYKKDVLNTAQNKVIHTWYTDIIGWKVNGKELAKIKMDNIEVFNTNVELERLGKLEHWILPLRKSKQQKQWVKENAKTTRKKSWIGKINTQQQLNNNVNMCMSWQKNISPLDYVENKYRSERLQDIVKDNIHLILWYKKEKEKLQKAYNKKQYANKLMDSVEYKKFEIKQLVYWLDSI